ncbi:MAG: hypothetical protein MUC78_14260, partial [Bacteroidales bacterium]|nr:hypothetical protein [Bacteroidales bacterium]
MIRKALIIMAVSLLPPALYSQGTLFTPGGFVRGGSYFSTGDYEHNINAAYADATLTLTATDNISFKGFADLRVRLGQQFGENVNSLKLREGWGTYYNSFMSISAGQKIVKWGKSDFTSPLSRFNPVDYTFRSPDREDAELGNLLAELTVTPSSFFRLSVVATPLWNPSVLIISPVEVPDNIQIEIPTGLMTEEGYHSLGARGDITLRSLDAGFQYYHGPELMPGLTLASADFTNPMVPLINIKGVPYIINSAGIDFETVIEPVVMRGTLAYSKPVEEKAGNEEIPFPQLDWILGGDWSSGRWRVTAEYSGKKVSDFYEPPYDPLIGTEPDLEELYELFMTPGFDPVEYARLQTEAVNRLYNYQMKEYYHSAGVRLEAEFLYGKLIPSVSAVYNFTSEDLLLLPVIKYKPSDGLTISGGMEYYTGPEGSLYDIIDNFMNSVFFS